MKFTSLCKKGRAYFGAFVYGMVAVTGPYDEAGVDLHDPKRKSTLNF